MTDDYALVIDDDADIRETIVTILETYGYRGESAGDGAEALAFLRGTGSRPRLILLDLMMPNVNGIEFRRAQLADPAISDVPVVLMTGAPAVSRDPTLVGLDVLVKPVDLRTLLSHVERHMARSEVTA
ncbi:MAG TPA: response regulator [Kofleriaceae bacterium]|nr:response regulator [Kofleriaceae bacterium]